MQIDPRDHLAPRSYIAPAVPPHRWHRRILRAAGLAPAAAPGPASGGMVLAALLAQLGEGAAVIARYRIAATAGAPVALELSLHGDADASVAGSQFRTLTAWARLAAPELRFATLRRGDDAADRWLCVIRPEPAAIPAFASPAIQPLRPRMAAPGLGVALPQLVGGVANGLDACLDVLTGHGRDAELELTLEPVLLDAPRLRAIDDAIAALRAALHRQAVIETERTLDAAVALRRAGRAVRAGLRLSLAGGPDPALADLLSRLFHGVPAAGAAAPPALDLSACRPASVSLPDPLPSPAARLRLGIGAATRPGARRLPAQGILLGTTAEGEAVRLGRRDQSRHAYVIGATGVGKSTLLAQMIRQDIAAGRGVILFDPHGDLFHEIRTGLPGAVAARARIADVADTALPFGLNILDGAGGDAAVERNLICNQLIDIFKRALYAGVPEAFGPMFDSYFRNALMLLMEAGGPEVTLADFDRVFADKAYRARLLDACQDAQLRRFWRDIAEQVRHDEVSITTIAPYIVSKLTRFTGNPLIRPIITRPTTLDLAGGMERGDVCLINLAKGVAGSADAALLGGLILTRLLTAVLRRAALPPARRRVMRLYLDEFQSYATDALADLLAESRKFGLECVLANQSLGQIEHRGGDVAHAVLANVGTVVAFRVGPEDAMRLARWFEPEIGKADLMRLADHEAALRMLTDGRPQPAFRFHTRAPDDAGAA